MSANAAYSNNKPIVSPMYGDFSNNNLNLVAENHSIIIK